MKTLFTLLVLAISLGSMGQSQFDERLLEKFSEEKIQELSTDHPKVLDYWTFYLDNSFEIIDVPFEKDFSESPEIKIKDLEDFNILELDINMLSKASQEFRIKNTDKLLILHSSDRFTKLFNAHINKNNFGS
ncbi:MAG: hypothetical protein WBG42_01850 [Cryomorphaceae bacterium]